MKPKNMEGDVGKESVQIPLIVTQKMKNQLRSLGFSIEEVDKLTPAETWEIIHGVKEIIREDGTSDLYLNGKLQSKIFPDGTHEFYKDNGELLFKKSTDGNFKDGEKTPPGKNEAQEQNSQEGEVIKSTAKNSKNETREERRTPEKEVSDFISEYKLEEMLPAEFANLDKAQKLKVVQDLKRRIVDIVKADAQTQYSEDLKKKVSEKVAPEGGKLSIILKTLGNLPGSALSGIKNAAAKETNIKKIEGKVFTELRESEEGKKLIAEDLARLVDITKEKNLHINSEGVPYTTYEDLFKEIKNPTPEEWSALHDFGDKANEFEKMPYEWGQEAKGKHKKEYEKAKAEYEKAREGVLKIKSSKETQENKGQAMLSMLFVDQNLQMEQLLNTHPEIEKTLESFKDDAGFNEWKKTGKNFFNTLTGKNWTNRALIVGGAAARAGAKGAAIASGASGLGFLGGAAAGGVIGGIRGRIRAKETLTDRQRNARHGDKDVSKEKAKMVDATKLASGLEKMRVQVEQATNDGEKAKLLGKLAVVVDYTQNLIEGGKVNFGSAKDALQNQFNIVLNLNQALVTNELNSEKINISVKEKINGLIARQEKVEGKKVSEAQKKFISKQMWQGAKLGAGFATIGYVARWAGEELGWWGHIGEQVHAPTGLQHQVGSEGFIKRAEDWVDNHNPFSHHTENINPRAPKAPGLPKDYATNPAYSTLSNNFHETSITFEHGHGGIKGIQDLQRTLHEQYPDISKAPKGIQDFVNTDPTKEAIKLGLYDGHESALIKAGAKLQIDENGKISVIGWDGKMMHPLHIVHEVPHQTTEAEALKPIDTSGIDNSHIDDSVFQTGHPNVVQDHFHTGGDPGPGYHDEDHVQPHNLEKPVYNNFPQHQEIINQQPQQPIYNEPQPTNPAEGPMRNTFWGSWQSGPYNSNGYYDPRSVSFFNSVPSGPVTILVDGHQTEIPSYIASFLGHHNDFPITTDSVSFLEHHPSFIGFAKNNYFHMSYEGLEKAYLLNHNNLEHIFPGQHLSDWQSNVGKMKAVNILNGKELEHGEVQENTVAYLRKLIDMSGLKPKSGLFGKESTADFMNRAVQKIVSEKGNLDSVRM